MENQKSPLISIITVVYNGAEHIECAINSVINQTYKNIEYIIIDGGSTDGTVDIIKKYESKISFWISEKDNGIYDAMNKGIKKCNGQYIGILNSDDYYENNTCEIIKNEILTNNKVDIFHANIRIVTATGKTKYISKPKNENKLRTGMVLKHPSCFISKNWYNKIGLYDTNLKIASDFKFLYKSLRKKANFKYLNFITTNMREGGVSDTQAKKGWKEVENICIEFGDNKIQVKYYSLIRSLKYFINKKILHNF